ncbi:MAG: DNA alkylation repair protein [Thermoanaerobaculia bacterium]
MTPQRRLRELADPRRAKTSRWFFKTGPGHYGEGDRFLGLTVPQLRLIAREFRALPLAGLTRLLQSPWHEERLLALIIAMERYTRGDWQERDALFRFYLDNLEWVNNWDLVDVSAPAIVGTHLQDAKRSLLVRLARSKSLWERRVAIVATQHFIRNGDLADTFRIAKMLLRDEQDLIHKATGWMLREAGKKDRAALEKFLNEHAAKMPRTMLRYAIEKFPPALRRRFLARP